MTRLSPSALCLLAAIASSVGQVEAGCTNPDGSCTESVALDGTHFVRAHRTQALGVRNTQVIRAVIVVHGTNADAGDYFSRMILAADDQGVAAESLIAAPWFRESSDLVQPGELYWLDASGQKWDRGDPSSNPGTSFSSFEVLDRLVSRVADRALFPNLTVIAIVGHSGGAQYVQRYAAGGRGPASYTDHGFVFVVANPSSYMYLDQLRPLTDSTTAFAVPSTTCRFNDYRYGMDYMNDYMNDTGAQTIVSQYLNRFVVYLAGELDDDPADPTLDTTCRAMWQGPHRLARETAYANYIERFYPTNRHRLLLVPGVGHSSTQMFRSPEGRSVIFIDEADIPGSPAPPVPPTGLRVL